MQTTTLGTRQPPIYERPARFTRRDVARIHLPASPSLRFGSARLAPDEAISGLARDPAPSPHGTRSGGRANRRVSFIEATARLVRAASRIPEVSPDLRGSDNHSPDAKPRPRATRERANIDTCRAATETPARPPGDGPRDGETESFEKTPQSAPAPRVGASLVTGRMRTSGGLSVVPPPAGAFCFR